MSEFSRRKFLQLSALAGTALVTGDWVRQAIDSVHAPHSLAAEPIKIGIIDPLTSPYKTSSIHDVHGATVALDMFNKRGGVLGRPITSGRGR